MPRKKLPKTINRQFVIMAQQEELAQNMSSLITENTYDGEDCWVIPTILMAEGVHNGLYYSSDMFTRFVGSWNGEPVTVGHPTKGGKSVSANSPEVLEAHKVGWMFNVRVEDGKLKGDAWVSKERANTISPVLCQMIADGSAIEVSTGVFIEDDGEAGSWNEEEFKATVTTQAPDHLALLPGGVGACSWDDGGGAPRTNQAEADERGAAWSAVRSVLVGNTASFNEIEMKIRAALQEAYPPPATPGDCCGGPYIVDTFEKTVVFEVHEGGKFVLRSQAYALAADESVSFVGDAVIVSLKREYVPVGNDAEPENKTTTNVVATRGDDMNRKDQVTALIEDTASRWGEESRDHLMALEQDVFERTIAEPEPVVAAADTTPATPAEAKPIDVNALIASDPSLKRAVKREQDYRANLVKELVANARCKFTEEQMADKDVDELETLASCFDVEVDYSGRSTAPAENEEDDPEKIDAPLALNFSTEEN